MTLGSQVVGQTQAIKIINQVSYQKDKIRNNHRKPLKKRNKKFTETDTPYKEA